MQRFSSKMKFLLLLFFVTNTFGDLEITLSSHNDSLQLRNYYDYKPFKKQYANTHGDYVGYLHEPISNNACNPRDNVRASNATWIALVEDYPSCPTDLILKVKEAGYHIVITSSHSVYNLANTLDFPVVIVGSDYATYLRENTLSDLDSFSNSSVNVQIKTNNNTTNVAASVLVICLLFIVFVCLLVGCKCSHKRVGWSSNQRDAENQGNRRLRRVARREVADGARRQLLQNMQGTGHTRHVPLGEEHTKTLPLQKYDPEKDKNHTCAICVEEFENGDILRVLTCGHVFHTLCVDEWLIKYSALCPMCKKEVLRQSHRPCSIQEDIASISSGEVSVRGVRIGRVNMYHDQYGSTDQ